MGYTEQQVFSLQLSDTAQSLSTSKYLIMLKAVHTPCTFIYSFHKKLTGGMGSPEEVTWSGVLCFLLTEILE